MNEAIVLHMDKLWFLFEGESARVVPEFPRLDGPAVVITDFGGALCGVAAVGGRSAYAEALIGRRLRDEGLIDGEARVLVHHVLKDGGGFQALYTAVPIDIWQRMMSWAQAQQETCLIVPQAAAMCQVLPRGDQGVIFRHKRRLSLLLRRREGLGYFSVLSLSDGREDLLASVKTLANRFLERSSAAEPTVDFRWFSLSGPGVADEDEGLCAAFAQATGARATRVDVSLFHGENGECRRSRAGGDRVAIN